MDSDCTSNDPRDVYDKGGEGGAVTEISQSTIGIIGNLGSATISYRYRSGSKQKASLVGIFKYVGRPAQTAHIGLTNP